MLSIALKLVAIFMALILSGCERNEPPWKEIASSGELAYKVRLKTFDSEGHADSPIELAVATNEEENNNITRLKTTQCKSVEVVPTASYLYIFYAELALSDFGSTQYESSLPRLLLCDIHHPSCQALRKSLLSERYVATEICTYDPN